MKILVPFFLVLAQVSVGGPTQVQDPAYPLRIRVITRNVSRSFNGGVKMWGRADLFGTTEQGFDYEADCGDLLLMVTHGDERYSAKWKKQDRELEVLISKVGTGKNNKCTVKADLKPFTYETQRGEVITKPLPTN